MIKNDLHTFDRQHIWHPFTQADYDQERLLIEKAQGAYLFDDQGKRYLDLISSWWVTPHGHTHPKIAQAIAAQAQKLDQVIFAGNITHAPAIQLTQKLQAKLPAPLNHFFFSDNGSTSVEVAIKMVIQFWRNQKKPQKNKFICFEGGYHGDTFGAMSVGQGSCFFNAFKDFCFETVIMPYPHYHDQMSEASILAEEKRVLSLISEQLSNPQSSIGGIIIEPLIQGAGGMRFSRPSFLNALLKLAQAHEVLTIFDEVMTGFGRTGRLFALDHLTLIPSILCLSKGLSGGFLPLSLTVVHDQVFEAFCGQSAENMLIHGHSYTANPIACAAGCASLDLFDEEDTLARIKRITKIHQTGMKTLIEHFPNQLHAPRVMGDIAAIDIHTQEKSGYFDRIGATLREIAQSKGLLIRPLGNVLYLMPPYCIAPSDLEDAYTQLIVVLEAALKKTIMI